MHAKCPICGKESVEKYKPFCCKRCADVDLNRWLGEVYAIPVDPKDDEDTPDERQAEENDRACD